MSLGNKLFGASLTLGLVFGLNAFAFSQQPQSPAQGQDAQQQEGRPGKFGRHGGRREMGGMMRMFHGLDLTDAQKQQAQAIFERYKASTQAQRDELRQIHQQSEQGTLSPEAQERARQLRQQLEQTHQQMRAELLNILTPEQRAKVEERQREFEERRQRMRENNPTQPNNNQ